MKKGFIVGKIKYNDRNVFHCVDVEGKNQFFFQDEMIAKLDKGEYVNGFACGYDSGAYVRLVSGIPTFDRRRNFNLMEFCDYVVKYLSVMGSEMQIRRAWQIALKNMDAPSVSGKRNGSAGRGKKTSAGVHVRSPKPPVKTEEFPVVPDFESRNTKLFLSLPVTDMKVEGRKLYASPVQDPERAVLAEFSRLYSTGGKRISLTREDVSADGIGIAGYSRYHVEENIVISKRCKVLAAWIRRAAIALAKKNFPGLGTRDCPYEGAADGLYFMLESNDTVNDWAFWFGYVILADGAPCLLGTLGYQPKGSGSREARTSWCSSYSDGENQKYYFNFVSVFNADFTECHCREYLVLLDWVHMRGLLGI